MRNADEKTSFADRVNRNTCSHAYIIDGEAGIGKLDFALFCANALVCSGETKPCGVCAGCKKALSGTHPDIYIYGREKAASIDDVRSIIRHSAIKPNDAEKQIFIIENAGKLREEAQNALLKIFEEPPESVVVFLLTESRSRLLPTLLSRGQQIHLSGASEGDVLLRIKREFPELPADMLTAAAEESGGNLEEARALLSKERSETRKKAARLLSLALSGNSYGLASMLILPKYKREQLSALLTEFVAVILGISKKKYGCDIRLFPETEAAAEGVPQGAKKPLARMGEIALRALENLEQNANVTSCASRLSIDLLAAARQ